MPTIRERQLSSSKYTIMKLFLFASLVASTNALQMVSAPVSAKAKASPRIPSKLRYSLAEDVPQAASTPDFTDKVRKLMQSTTTKKKGKKGLPNLKSIDNKDDLKKAVLEDEDRLTVVRFYAPYCQSCKKMEPLLHRFARRNPYIQFIDVAYTQERSNRNLVHSLGVPSFPYFHLYHPASLGLVEEHSINSKYFKDVANVIESYQDGGCDLPPNPNDEGIYGSPYKSLEADGETSR